ncbi:hypothetical protein BVG16_05650 [Paenibacillus selenitireducens]|uniref:Uncharacterized protein n=1 Tax=Paenibacillus selenitireducens TaxID=1324314 RepID=A0A1T2XK82_9BACL|nr:hypothetical protein [Paenibacillus selenitireducens]OPA80228.1 hypothetical protein BVG16_05650 [Paenibacillus selenitireducens]
MATTPKLNLPLIDHTMIADVPRDMNALANALDAKVETTEGAQAKADHVKTYVDTELLETASKPLNLNYGKQIVEAENTCLYELTGLKGRTLVNLLGRRSNFEDALPVDRNPSLAIFELDAERVNNLRSLKITNKHAADRRFMSFFDATSDIPTFYANKYYLCVGHVKPLTNQTVVEMAGTSFLCPTINTWTNVVLKINPTTDKMSKINIISTTVNDVVKIAGFRLLELSKADYDEIATMTDDQVVAKYPYVDSLQNVANPYVIGYGENLLPPFTEWYPTSQINLTPVSAYEATVNKKDGANYATAGAELVLTPNTDARFAVTRTANFTAAGTYGTYLNVFSVDGAGNQTQISLADTSYNTTKGTRDLYSTFRVPSDSVYIRVIVGVDTISTGTFTFKNPVITLGTVAKLFVPRQDSMIKLTTELASNVDGTVTDELFAKDGQYWKLAKWKKVLSDGSSISSPGMTTKTGYKVLALTHNQIGGLPDNVHVNIIGVKYDGKILPFMADATAGVDVVNIYNKTVYISVSNADSGWGDAYTPTADEIKAYFNGYIMFNGANEQPPYNGTGKKAWIAIDEAYLGSSATRTEVCPTSQAPKVGRASWQPYQLQYQLATPTIEPIPHEGKLMLHNGANLIECGVGMEVHEHTNPAFSVAYDTYEINSIGKNPLVAVNPLKNKVSKIRTVFRNRVPDTKWISNTDENSNGAMRVFCKASDYNTTAVYHVTYTRLENNVPFTSINGQVSGNIRGTVNDLVDSATQLDTRLSIVERMKVMKDSHAYIHPTLLNGWVPYAATAGDDQSYDTARYYKDGTGRVYISGIIKGGAITNDTILFVLPVGYRPHGLETFATVRLLSSDLSNYKEELTRIAVTSAGDVMIKNVLGTAGNAWLNLSGISFQSQK